MMDKFVTDDMTQCDRCNEWVLVQDIETLYDSFDGLDEYVCPACARKTK